MKTFVSISLLIAAALASSSSHAQRWDRGRRGGRVEQPLAHHAALLRNVTFALSIRAHERNEAVRGRAYWHVDRGIRYAHYYDARGAHWYGFYWGPHFYWTRYSGNRWWWFDAPLRRWVYWWSGFWWWTGPGGAAYYYNGTDFVPYGGTVEMQPVPAAAPVAAPEPPPTPATFSVAAPDSISPDGARFVQVIGPRSEAYLYARKNGDNVFVNYLGPDVESVRYSGGGDSGLPLQVLVNRKNGTFIVFDRDGKPQEASAPAIKGPAPKAAAASTRASTPKTAAPATATAPGNAAMPALPKSAPPPLDAAPPAPDDQPPAEPPSDSGAASQ